MTRTSKLARSQITPKQLEQDRLHSPGNPLVERLFATLKSDAALASLGVIAFIVVLERIGGL